VTTWPTEYATHVVHGVAAAHCDALTASCEDAASSLGAEPHPNVEPKRARAIVSVFLRFMSTQ
jgi:hypothetical protein